MVIIGGNWQHFEVKHVPLLAIFVKVRLPASMFQEDAFFSKQQLQDYEKLIIGSNWQDPDMKNVLLFSIYVNQLTQKDSEMKLWYDFDMSMSKSSSIAYF